MQTQNYNELKGRADILSATAVLASARYKDQSVATEDPNELPEIGNKLLTLERALDSMKEHLLVLSQRLAPVLAHAEATQSAGSGRVTAIPKSEIGKRLESVVEQMFALDAGVSQTIERLAL